MSLRKHGAFLSAPFERSRVNAQHNNIVLYWQNQVRRYGERAAYRAKLDGEWVYRSWQEYGQVVKQFAMGLLSLGLRAGDRVAILGSTREEWDWADRATLAVGGIGVGVYHSSTPEQIRYIVDHSEASILVVEDENQWRKIEEIRTEIPRVKKFVLMDPLSDMSDECTMSFAELLALGQKNEDALEDEYCSRGKAIETSDAAIYVYTSGTTGPPKGAVLTHGNILAIMEAFGQMGIFVPEEDRTVAWLPLPHVFGRFVILSAIYTANTWTYAGEIDTLIDDLADIQPTVFHSVPRIYEKIYQKMTSGMAQASPTKRMLFDYCVKIGSAVSRCRQEKRPIPFLLRMKHLIAERLVFRKLRGLFGGRIRCAITGGAPLSKEILEFFHAAGILILEAYGLTESPSAAFNRPDDFRFGTVGPPVPGMEIRIAEDGEILLRSPIVFAGYLKDPEKTREAFRDDGWYCTGDIGVLSPDGFVTITDRKKDIIITAGGKNVAPQNIENLLKTSPMISQVMVYGDRKPYLTALFTLDPEALAAWGEAEGLKVADLSGLCRNERLRERIGEIVKEKSRSLASFETIKRFEILPQDFALDTGEITPTLKVKRRFVTEKYRELLEGMYN
jgi:long-chain acyl-CoA synthetase